MWTDGRRAGAVIVAALLALAGGACVTATRPQRPTPGSVAKAPAHAVAGNPIEVIDKPLATALQGVLVERTPARLVDVAHRYRELGVLDTAMDYYAEALRPDATFAPALDGSARIWRDWGQLDRALADAHRATYFAPSSAEAWNTLGTVLQVLQRPADAEAAYRRAMALDIGAGYARSNLGYLWFLGGRHAESIAMCAEAIDVDAGLVPARNNLALAYAASGDSTRALEAFTLAGGVAAAQYNIGMVLLAERRYRAAVAAFEAAYRAQPSFDRAYLRARHARRLALEEETHAGDRR